MASSSPSGDYLSHAPASPSEETEQHDPFFSATSPPAAISHHHRFSNFDPQIFALGPNLSPAQAKRALEAHLSETDRRMEEAGKLGTALVQQRKELTERLKDVEKLQAEGELSQDLRQKLSDIEKEYNEVARESARAFLPKQRVPSNEAASGSPFIPEGKGGRRSVSPSKFEAQATGSPTKLSVPNRKIRNQPSNRVHDIEFAAEISTSLIAQVRNLQALLAEKEEELKETKGERSRLEYEAENFHQRVKALDENEHRYKDENWNLETQLHELMTAQKDAADREKKLNQSLNLLQAEKNATQQKLDEVRLSHSKLVEEHAAAVKRHDIELGTSKRNMVLADSERGAMQRKIEELTSQNQELAKAFSLQRGRTTEREQVPGISDEDFETANDNPTPEHSPPPSPIKGTPRHSMLETETLKTSLGHAQRTIQSLRANYHREKTEKLELRRMLHEARDEVEKIRNDPIIVNKRTRKAEAKEIKKPAPRLLGGLRSIRSEVFTDDSNWEDQPDHTISARPSPETRSSAKFVTPAGSIAGDDDDDDDDDHFETANDNFETANDTSDAAFETANERGTETDDFHTGAEDFSTDDDTETETESPSKRNTLRLRQHNLPMGLGRSRSIDSTASTEDEDDYYHFEGGARTPPNLPPLQSRFPLRVSRGAFRRSRQASEEPVLQSSPSSFTNRSIMGTPQQPVKSLAAELGDFEGSDNESNMSATPSRRSIRARTASPPPAVPRLPKLVMVDSGMMTDPVPEMLSVYSGNLSDRPMSRHTVISRHSTVSLYTDASVQENLDKIPSTAKDLALSSVHSQEVEPLPETDTHAAEVAAIRAEHAEQTKQLANEHATAQATALESLRAEHAEQMRQLGADHAVSQTASSKALEVRHAEEISKAQAMVKDAFIQEIEALRSSHAKEISKVSADALAAHVEEVKTLRDTHAKEIDALKTAHAEQLALRDAESKAAHAAEIEALAARHSEEMAAFKTDNDAAHTAELNAMQAKNSDEVAASLEKIKATHAAEVEALRAKHSEEVLASKRESDASHAADLEALRTKHLDGLSSTRRDMEATHAVKITALEASHSEALSSAKKNGDAARVAEIEELTAAHATQIEQTKSRLTDAHTNELETLKASHTEHIKQVKNELLDAHAEELESLKSSHVAQLEQAKQDSGIAHAEQLEALKEAHSQEIGKIKESINATHSGELEVLKESHEKQIEELREESKATHATEIAALVALHAKELESFKTQGEATLSRELTAIKNTHAQEIESLKNQFAAAHAQELEGFKAALAKQVESSQVEGDAAHTQQLEALNAAHVEILESHKRESEASQTQALDSLKASHEKQMEQLKSELAAAKSVELESLAAGHLKELEALRTENASSLAKLMEDLANTHALEIENTRSDSETTKENELAALRASHVQTLEALKAEHDSTRSEEIESLKKQHVAELTQELEALKTQQDEYRVQELDQLKEEHTAALSWELEALKTERNTVHSQELKNLEEEHARILTRNLEALRKELDATRTREIEELKGDHAMSLDTLRTEQQAALDDAINSLKTEHAQELDVLTRLHDTSQVEAIELLKTSQADQLDRIRVDNETVLARELDAANARYMEMLDAQKQDSSAERDGLLKSHAAALEALRVSLIVPPPTLGMSSVSTVETEPIEMPGDRSPRREAFIIPREIEQPQTPHPESKAKAAESLLIAEDETRQSPRIPNEPETPESQRPLKEISTNTDAQARRKAAVPTTDHSSQTTLTADSLGRMFGHKRQLSQDSVTIVTARGEVTVTPFGDAVSPSAVLSDAASSGTVRVRRSHESIGSISRAKHRMTDSGALSTPEPIPSRRPGSSASGRTSAQPRPPLPANHREAIEAARTTSSSGGKGTMGPPSLPASAYKNPASRPWTPSSNPPLSPSSLKNVSTPRAARAQMHSPSRMPLQSSQSSVSSFVSELDTRFNIRSDMGVDTSGFGPNTDPRMIQAITQTMIGEYLWKYTRKAGREEMSEKRHRRYFWVHPYTRTLNWSDSDPSAGRSETKAKSVPIEAVRVVTDDNPMPPGLHRKSLIIVAPGRTIKFTCTTGQRHETWFNALSYLLLRTGEELQPGAEDGAGNITQEDVDEFNPSAHRRGFNTKSRGPPSLSSYNSRTTRNESPNIDAAMSIPTLTPTRERGSGSGSIRGNTLNRLSGYWKSGTISGTLGSLRSRGHAPNDSAIYEASEVHDSAEDLRQIIEEQDREADRLENVRACCDGKHDVGTLSHSARRGRLSNLYSHNSHTHSHPGPSTTPTPGGSVRSRA